MQPVARCRFTGTRCRCCIKWLAFHATLRHPCGRYGCTLAVAHASDLFSHARTHPCQMRAAAEAMLAQSSAATPAPSSTTAAATGHKRQRTSTQPAARSWADVASHSASVAAELLKTAPSSSSSGSWVRSATTSLAAWPVDGGCLLGYRDTQLTQVPQHSGIGTNARVAVDGCIHLEIRGQLRGHTRRVLGTPLALQVPSLAPSHPPLPSSLGCACVCVSCLAGSKPGWHSACACYTAPCRLAPNWGTSLVLSSSRCCISTTSIIRRATGGNARQVASQAAEYRHHRLEPQHSRCALTLCVC